MRRKGVSYAKYGYIFSIPFVLAYIVFQLYPLLFTTIIGFTDFKGIGRTDFKFLEDIFANFKSVIKNPSFKNHWVIRLECGLLTLFLRFCWLFYLRLGSVIVARLRVRDF